MESDFEDVLSVNYFTCPFCSTSYDFTEFHELEHMSKADPSLEREKLGHARCRSCGKDFHYYLTSDLYPILEKNPPFEFPPEDVLSPSDETDFIEPPLEVPIPEQPAGLLENDVAGSEENEPGKMAEFERAINAIDKQLPVPELFKRISQALDIIITEAPPQIEAGYALLQKTFKLTARNIEAFRKEVNSKRRRIENESSMEPSGAIYPKPPKELSEDEKQEAIEYLKSPDLFENISRDIAMAGEVIGEETNKMMLYLAATSRKFREPISLVIFGKSSSGKSHLANAIEKFMPEEETVVLSSMTAKALEYMRDQLKHKLLLIQEWEGLSEALPIIRTLQSEGKLARLHTAIDPIQKIRVARVDSQDCPCSVIVTTTKEGIHDENSTRIFELYADESVEQTKKVVRHTLMKADKRNRISEEEKERIFQLHQNVQRVLEPVYVNIPFADHFLFPHKTSRHRRDSKRFIELIRTVAFLRQKQKEVVTTEGINSIEADLEDYRIAYEIGLDVMRATLNSISNRAKNVLIVCCELKDKYIAAHKDPLFPVTEIQDTAQELGLDFGNRQDLYKQLDKLTEYEYLERKQARKNSIRYYKVCFAYERNNEGEIINIDAPDANIIRTPEEIQRRLEGDYNGRTLTYVLKSALQKAIRRGETNDARYFAQRFIDKGQPGGVLNDLPQNVAEDVGLADPTLPAYVRDCHDTFEKMLKEKGITRSKVSDCPEICAVIHQVVIAAALSYKSRLLPMLSFVTLFDIYKKEDFSHDLGEYENRLREAIQRRDEKEAAYYAYVVGLFVGSEDSVLKITQQESGARNKDLIDEWTQEYKRTKHILFLAGIISLLCRDLDYPHGEYRDQVSDWLSVPIEKATFHDWVYDQHTLVGKREGRGLKHFFDEGAPVKNEAFANNWEKPGREAYLQAKKEGLEKAVKVIDAIKKKLPKNYMKGKTRKEFVLDLPFEYKKAVLTQERTSPNKPYAFIVELDDGSRQFVKGPFKNVEAAQHHLTYNVVKSKLESEYLHPIPCEVLTINHQITFLLCDELGKADLNKVEKRETKLDGTVEVLVYDESNDVVPDPLNFLTEIKKENEHIWIEMMVNYCFRWVFGIGDTARRNLMLEKSTGKIYSTDEIFLKSARHENIWGGRRPGKEKFELIRKFAKSESLNEVLIEVERWKNALGNMPYNLPLKSEEVERRIDHFLENPDVVLELQK